MSKNKKYEGHQRTTVDNLMTFLFLFTLFRQQFINYKLIKKNMTK